MGEPASGYTSKSSDKGNATWGGSKASIVKESLTQLDVTISVAWQPYKSKAPPAIYIVYPSSNSQVCSNFQLLVVRTHQLE